VKHATVRLGEYTVPLIGVPEDATLETCDTCKKKFNLRVIVLDEHGVPKCPKCLKLSPATAKSEAKCLGYGAQA
jgi:hypothetical protein